MTDTDAGLADTLKPGVGTVTVTVFDVTEPLDALTFVLPAASAERRPAELIVAVGVLDEFHVIVGDMAFPN